MKKQAYTVRNVAAGALVSAAVAAHPDDYEWLEPDLPAGAVYDAAGQKGLLLFCANCGMRAETLEDGCACPDCGEEEFYIRRRFVRQEAPLPGFALRLTGKKGHHFLHVDLPPEQKKAAVHYTLDGTTPTYRSARYAHPISLGKDVCFIRAVALFDRYRSPVTELEVEDAGYSYRCPLCGRAVRSPNPVAVCPDCGFRCEVWADGNRLCALGVERTCDICGGSFVATARESQCPRCKSHYSFVKGKWQYGGHTQHCAHCGTDFTYAPRVQEYCPACSTWYKFRPSARRWAVALPARVPCPVCGRTLTPQLGELHCTLCGFGRVLKDERQTDTPARFRCSSCRSMVETARSTACCPACGTDFRFDAAAEGWCPAARRRHSFPSRLLTRLRVRLWNAWVALRDMEFGMKLIWLTALLLVLLALTMELTAPRSYELLHEFLRGKDHVHYEVEKVSDGGLPDYSDSGFVG